MISSKNGLLETASFTPSSLQAPDAWCGHLPFAAWLIRNFEPKIFIELGTHTGNSYFSFCQSVSEAGLATKCYAVDTWQGDEHAGNYGNEVFNQVNTHNQAHYATFSRLLRMTFDDARNYFADGSIELLHIDGLHTYEAVKHDFETWLPKLAPSAVILFHDTNVRERSFGVWKLWEELQNRYSNNLEFLHSHGLGVLQLDGATDAKKLAWLDANSVEQQQLKNYFSALGARQLERFELGQTKIQVANLNQGIAERDGQIANLNHAVAERDEQIASLNHAVAAKETHIRNLDAIHLLERNSHMASTNQVLAEINESTSWRLTAPVRLVGRQLLRIKVVFRALPYARAMCGGYRSLFKHVWNSYKKEGISGIKLRIAFSASPGTPPPIIGYVEINHNDYTEWVRRYDTLADADRKKIKARISQMTNAPLISVVMPVYNPPLEMLKEAIQSVRNQIYPNWELCIADDASTDRTVHDLLEHYTNLDARIKVVFRKTNGHISAASNSALELVKGEYIALLDNDDILREHSLYCVAQAIVEHADAGLIYSDEDKIDRSGRRYDPYFKPDWNPDLFLSHNMICHLGVYRADLVRKLGGFREGYEGAQDYDLALRCTEQLTPQQIVHIPRVLYHWRSHPGSTAQAGSEKSYAQSAGERALNDHFARIGHAAKAELLDFGMYRVRYDIPQPAPLVSLIIPTRNGLNLIKQCVDSILNKTVYKNFEILIVDNNSDDPQTLKYLARVINDRRIRVFRDEQPFNYSALNNSAMLHARGEYLGLINNDIEVITPQWLDEMMSLAIQPGVGAVGSRLWYPNDTLQHGGVITGLGGVAGHSHKHLPKGHPGYFSRAQLIQTLSAVTAACLVIKKSIYKEVGGLDETNLKVAFNDIDFCMSVREAGYRNVWTPYAELYHHESATRGYEDTKEKQLRFQEEVLYMQKRWGETLSGDPAYSPNLTLDREGFSYAWPPRVPPLAG